MRVNRLEIFGFKSFLDRLVLPLEGGITGVVGPNGCGKSNIVDALRWVLGETKASNLRGGVLEDVIFNGTDKLRPLGLAEVTLTLRASEKGFFEDITSALPPLDMKRIETLSPDSAPQAAAEDSRPQLVVIDGALGRPDNETEPPGEDQIPVVDEMSAQAGEGARDSDQSAQEIAGEELEAQTQTLLTRFAWLRSVEEVQVTRRLYRSGESEFFINRVPCRLKDIKDLFRAMGLGARTYTIVAQGEVSRIVTARPEERRLILEEAAGVSGFRDRIAAAQRRLEETGINLARLDDVIKEVTRQVNSLRVQASRARNRQQLKERLTSIERALYGDVLRACGLRQASATASLEQAQREEARLDAVFQRMLAEEQEQRGILLSVDVESDGLRAKVDSLREELDGRVRQRGDVGARVGAVRAYVRAKEAEIKDLAERKSLLDQRLAEGRAELEVLDAKRQEVSSLILNMTDASGVELERLAAQISQVRVQLQEKEQEQREIRDDLVGRQARLQALREQLDAASPLNQFGRIMECAKDASTNAALPSGLLDHVRAAELLAESIQVEAPYAVALQAVLGERAAFLVSSQSVELARFYAGASQSCELPALGVFQAYSARAPMPSSGAVGQDLFPRLLDFISCAASSRPVVERLLSHVLVCETAEEAFAFFDGRNESSLTDSADVICVTLRGEVITRHSFQSRPGETGLVQQKREAFDLELALEDLHRRHERATGGRDELCRLLSELEQKHSKALSDAQAQQTKLREFSSQQAGLQGRIQANLGTISQMEQDLRNLDLTTRRNISERDDLLAQERELAARARELSDEKDYEIQEELARLREQYSALEAQRRAGREKLSELSQRSNEAREQREAARQEVSSCSLDGQKIELERQAQIERIRSEYGEQMVTEVEQALANGSFAPLTPQEVQEHREESSRIRSRILREGEVDGSSIERFEEEKARLEELTVQKHDLEEAQATLKHTIERLRTASEQRFVATFQAVKENFGNLIPRLFGGGRGSLELLDPAHPLESGVEIVVRPPGKKLKTIELLSGGEKALCAIALIVSMFLQRPSPLCVLDEVDAPLDDANLMRFLSLIKDMSSRTQFLMVTHNKQSMAMSDNLVGVTMQQPGASKIITVSLQEAYAHVA